MATELRAELVLDARALLGEGPVWDDSTGVLWWVDIDGRLIHRFDPSSGSDSTIPTASEVGALALRQGGGLLVALADGVWTLEPSTGAWGRIVGLGEPADVRCNDAKCDPAGRFVVGTMAFDEGPVGSLFSVAADGSVRRLLHGLRISNGLAWSAEGDRFYFIDSPTRLVDAYDYDLASGSLARRRPYLEFDDPVAQPDGMSIDAEGGLWIAFWDGWAVRRYDADGRLDTIVHVPAAHVTSCAFGGPDLSDLYITTARVGLSELDLASQPHAGGLFRVAGPVPGRLPDRFAG